MELPDLKKSIKNEISNGAEMQDVLKTVWEVFEDWSNRTRVDSFSKEFRNEVTILVSKAFYKAEELDI